MSVELMFEPGDAPALDPAHDPAHDACGGNEPAAGERHWDVDDPDFRDEDYSWDLMDDCRAEEAARFAEMDYEDMTGRWA